MAQQTNIPTTIPALRTPQQVQNWFRENGLTVADWSTAKGFNATLVYAVIKGERKCLRGQSHCIAVALGLKSLPNGTETTNSDQQEEAYR